jgi:hypothetical protein
VSRVLITKIFSRFARKNGIRDDALCYAIHQASSGLIDADLGAGLIKQRVARAGKGKSGGFRTIVAFRSRTFACFLYGFAKSSQDNIDSADLSHLRDLAAELFELSTSQIDQLITDGNLIEVKCHDQTISQPHRSSRA